jgi:hypothetical protein
LIILIRYSAPSAIDGSTRAARHADSAQATSRS